MHSKKSSNNQSDCPQFNSVIMIKGSENDLNLVCSKYGFIRFNIVLMIKKYIDSNNKINVGHCISNYKKKESRIRFEQVMSPRK